MRQLSALRVTHHKYSPDCVHAQRQKTLLIMMIWVLYRDRELVTQSLLGMSKADAMLCLIAAGFFRVKYDVHRRSIHMIYIYTSGCIELHSLQ